MCLGIPGRIEALDDSLATVTFGSVIRKVDVRLIDEPRVGDYILVHAGFAINRISEADALETLALLQQIAEETGFGPSDEEVRESSS